MGVTCHSLVPETAVPSSLMIGMCFTAPHCNVSEQITCHRYRAAAATAVTAATAQASSSTRPRLPSVDGGEMGKPAATELVLLIEPVRTKREKGYYKVYSSMFDGNSSDTYMRI